MLTVLNLKYQKNNRVIFSNLGFSLFCGAALIISGKNGIGKTSLLKIIAGISKESNGKILWSGQDTQNFRADFNGDIQFIGHKNFFKNELSVFENLQFYARLYGHEDLIDAALSFFKLEDKSREKIKNLSTGWQKRAQLAMLLVNPATIWILDEPTSNLDTEGRELLKGLIETQIENGRMAIIATHDEKLFSLGSRLKMEDFLND